MSGRARAPVGAAERAGIFGNPATARTAPSSEAEFLPKNESRGRDGAVPVAVSHQGLSGSASATPYGALSPGRRRSFPSPNNNGNLIAPGRACHATCSPDRAPNGTPASGDMPQESGRSQVSRTKSAISESEGGNDDREDLLELEHIIGYTGNFPQTVVSHPEDSNVVIKSVGALLVIGAIADPHQQQLLRGHDMEISALAVSPSGSLIATGQCGSTRLKGYPSPVVLWDYATRTSLFILQGLTGGVCHLSFSPDQRFLLGCGRDRLVYVWDTNTGELVTGKQYSEAATFGEWTAIKMSGRRPVYQAHHMHWSVRYQPIFRALVSSCKGLNVLACRLLVRLQLQEQMCVCTGQDVLALELNFDTARRQWTLSGGAMATPCSGLRRRYHCSALLDGGKFLLCGTDVGDLVVYGVGAKVFRASIPICSGGMLSICTDHATGAVFCGAGNGVVRRIVGTDMVWRQEGGTKLDGGVVSLSMQADGCDLLAGTREGSIYRVLLSDLSASKISSSQKSPILSVACGSRVDTFATCAQDSTVRVWDLCDFGVVVEASERPRGAIGGALCICWLGEEAVVTGWSDSYVRCHDAATGALRWEISDAHRDAVTCCAVRFDASAAFLVTGSEDGSVSVWELRSRELLLKFCEHQKGVRAVLVDVASPHLVHSVGADCTVLTYDLRKEKRTVAHMTRSGAFQSMTQRLDSENELITCDMNGRLLMWDCDYRDPVQALQDPSQQRLTCVRVSPSGRYMAIGGDDEFVKVLDLANNCETVACGRAHAGSITSVQWTRDERQLVSAADDCTLAIWNFYGAAAKPPTDRPHNNGTER